ncbi:MAG: hypothetical protein WC781_02740 [Candidatus Pacearchaeota archaeon]|jgi:hypothetical protein
MKFKTVDDISREKAKQEREEMTEGFAEDIDNVLNKVQGKFILRKQKNKKKRGILKTIFWVLFFLVIFIIVLNFILLNVWALKFFIKSLFGI